MQAIRFIISTIISFEDLQTIHIYFCTYKYERLRGRSWTDITLKMLKLLLSQLDPNQQFSPTPLLHLPAPAAISSTQRWWNNTNATKTIWRGAFRRLYILIQDIQNHARQPWMTGQSGSAGSGSISALLAW